MAHAIRRLMDALYALCAAIAITSKYVIRFRGRHLFNPSNFGICVMLFLAAESVATLSIQWGNNLWPMVVIWVLGSAIIWRARRLHISATYVVSFFAFAFLRAWITHDPWQSEISPITGPESGYQGTIRGREPGVDSSDSNLLF